MSDSNVSDSPAPDSNMSRRTAVKLAGATGALAAATGLRGAPAIQKVAAANDQVSFGLIGTGSRGSYLLKHLKGIDNGHCVAVCDINQDHLNKGAETIGTNPAKYKDYRELLGRKDIDAVIIATPLFVHFPVTRDSLSAGKTHVFARKSLVFRPEEVHALRALAGEHSKQVLQVGLQRRYSVFYQNREGDDRQGRAGQRDPYPGAVEPQPRVEDETGPRPEQAEDGELAAVPGLLRRHGGGAGIAPDGCGGLDVRILSGVCGGGWRARLRV